MCRENPSIWCYLHTLLCSNEDYYEKVLTYLTAYDDGRESPLFSVINYISDKKNDNIIVDYDCFSNLQKERPEGRVHTSKVVRKKKFFSDGKFDTYKSRWTVRGFTFRKYIEFLRTFAPVAGALGQKLFMQMVIFYSLTMEQWDVTSAYLIPLLGLTGIWIEFPEDWHWEGNRYLGNNG